jgi:hypothetical protein
LTSALAAESGNDASTHPARPLIGVRNSAVPGAWHHSERYANNPVEADHGRLKSWLRPMRGLKRLGSARVISAGHAFVQNIRRGHHYELGIDEPTPLRVAAWVRRVDPGDLTNPDQRSRLLQLRTMQQRPPRSLIHPFTRNLRSSSIAGCRRHTELAWAATTRQPWSSP